MRGTGRAGFGTHEDRIHVDSKLLILSRTRFYKDYYKDLLIDFLDVNPITGKSPDYFELNFIILFSVSAEIVSFWSVEEMIFSFGSFEIF